MWNPFRTAREERRAEREAFLTAIQSMTQVTSAAIAASAAQTTALQTLLDVYKTSDPPQLREFDEIADQRRQLKRFHPDREPAEADLPAELRGKNLAEQFAALLDRMEA